MDNANDGSPDISVGAILFLENVWILRHDQVIESLMIVMNDPFLVTLFDQEMYNSNTASNTLQKVEVFDFH